jgi:DNA (cytosine-5)-methyltransferase 1
MKPRLLDLFCGAGGCSVGYHRAGFDIVGVDNRPQPHYPFEFVQADAMTYPLDGFDAIHASPPCQAYSRALKHMAAEQPMLIDAIKTRLTENAAPWIIENVEGAPIPEQADLFGANGTMLCGTAFGLRIYRHRLFETSFPLKGTVCSHTRHAMNPHSVQGRQRMYAEFGKSDPELIWRNEMGVEWMGRHETREAIPPAYTEHIGQYLMAELNARAAA